ncbi:GNAT family N-acetyltransferase [Paraburkholderia sp. DHOC27]|uniref:GNAT family N-acetyltransferase n=1 Tax=Paraburkholderia sp. DHOC27 TaxID=2303330 RepID=UPI000E3BBB97|nr:GNAT family N-acetyltransferase [Paraburkholderia sp. DHOC27]RFU46035.1 GNAT family N-acetyltransferase [Paraburkholderia sp. DHOC27]
MSDGLLPIAGSVPESLRFQYDVKSIANLAEFKTLRREWDELTSTARTFSFSLTYSYCEVAAARLMSAGGRVEVIRVYDAGRLCALWPVAIHRKGLLRVAKTLSCGTDEEYGGPLMRDETDHDVLMQAVRAATSIHADVLQVRFVRSDSALQGALEALPHSWLLPVVPQGLRDDVPGYTMDLRQYPRWEDFTATRSKSMLVDSRRHAKRLHAKGQVEMGWCRTAEDAEAILSWLFANKREWAKARGFHTPYLVHDEVRDFFIELARRIDLTAMPLVTFIRLDGVPVAASLNVVGSRYFEGLITTYDEALSDCSPGNLMHEFCMKWAHEKGCDFDLRPVFSTYKARWANHITRHSTHTLFLTLRGRLAEYGLLAGYAERIKGRLRDTLAERRRAAEKSARPDAS